jgi:tRNA(fMet)-specific endonuclease VapC
MTHYMLDTNTVSHALKNHPAVSRRLVAAPMALLCISAITQGELLFGLAKRPQATALHKAVWEFLRRVDVRPWDASVAEIYGTTRAVMQRAGKVLAPMDLLIGSHALSMGATLVTNDRAFTLIPSLSIEDWTEVPTDEIRR